MPIEQASVSKPAIRERETPSSSQGSWVSMQGSSTGGKDRPANSSWDNAILGAQKLFGLDKSKYSREEEKGEGEERFERIDQPARQDFASVPGFGNRSFGRFGSSRFGSGIFGMPAPQNIDGQFDANAESATVAHRENSDVRNEFVNTPKDRQDPAAKSEDKQSEVAHPLEEKDEAGEEKPKPAAHTLSNKALTVSPPLVQTAGPAAVPVADSGSSGSLNTQAISTTTTAESQTKEAAVVVQSTSVPSNGPNQNAQTDAASIAASAGKTNASPVSTVAIPDQAVASPAQTSAAAAAGAKPAEAVPQQTASTVSNSRQIPVQVRESLAGQDAPQPKAESMAAPQAVIPNPQAGEAAKQVSASSTDGGSGMANTKETLVANQSSSTQVSDSQKDAKLGNADRLGFDVAKAKETVSEVLSGTANQEAKARPSGPAVATPQASSQPAQQGPATPLNRPIAPQGEVANVRSPEGLLESKDVSSSVDSATKDAGQTFANKLVTRSSTSAARQASPGDALGQAQWDASAGRQPAPTIASASNAANSVREATASSAANQAQVAVSRPVSGGPNATTLQGANPAVSNNQGLAGIANAEQGKQAGSQGQQGASSGKQDFGSALKGATEAKGAEKSSGDASQAFDLKAAGSESSRKSEAAAKVRQTSYVSKTAQEVKEVVETLTKSIDRLVTNKPGTMNLRINFDQGGSMTLRISMEGGQVHTAMQTDVAGLESAIKANWSELANDWNQKGVKLNAPQFQNSESREQASAWNDFDDRGARQSAAGSAQDQARGRSGQGRGSAARAATNAGLATGAETGSENPAGQPVEVKSDTELKTYA